MTDYHTLVRSIGSWRVERQVEFAQYNDEQARKAREQGRNTSDNRQLAFEARKQAREKARRLNEWSCAGCGSDDPHAALQFEEIEVDVTCESVYITPLDGGPGFAFDFEKFDHIVDHYRTVTGR